MKPCESRLSLQRPVHGMAPTITSAIASSKEQLTLSHKLRKPLVEKVRRERINSSIEQLKALLGPELLNQQPDSKLEKADILEMTVCFLRHLQSAPPPAVNQGYSRCVQEALHFMSSDEEKTPSQSGLLRHLHNLQSSSDPKLRENNSTHLIPPVLPSFTKDKGPVHSAPWRPW